MKYVIAFAVLIVCAFAEPQLYDLNDDILIKTDVRDEVGQYAYSYQTKSGISAVEQGSLEPGRDGISLVQTGAYSYISPDGTVNLVRYRADKDGFQLL